MAGEGSGVYRGDAEITPLLSESGRGSGCNVIYDIITTVSPLEKTNKKRVQMNQVMILYKHMNNELHGYSAYENSEAITDLFKRRAIANVLDVGAGAGYYGKLIKDISPTTEIEAVEIWEATADYLRTLPCYNAVYETSILNFNWIKSYSLVVFGDVLEHLELDEAIETWHEAMASADIVVVSIPNGNYPQPAIYGNEAEAHKIENAEQDLIPLLDSPTHIYRYPITSTYIWEN